jgi:hypothetical protein
MNEREKKKKIGQKKRERIKIKIIQAQHVIYVLSRKKSVHECLLDKEYINLSGKISKLNGNNETS